jgi:hypothetical protein
MAEIVKKVRFIVPKHSDHVIVTVAILTFLDFDLMVTIMYFSPFILIDSKMSSHCWKQNCLEV